MFVSLFFIIVVVPVSAINTFIYDCSYVGIYVVIVAFVVVVFIMIIFTSI